MPFSSVGAYAASWHHRISVISGLALRSATLVSYSNLGSAQANLLWFSSLAGSVPKPLIVLKFFAGVYPLEYIQLPTSIDAL